MEAVDTYQRADGKWCSLCPECGIEQAYTLRRSAVRSTKQKTLCPECLKKAAEENSLDDRTRLYNQFKRNAEKKEREWALTQEQMWAEYRGVCMLTGWPLSIHRKSTTASLDRIDNEKGYTIDNVQWVHTMVNIAKFKYSQQQFIAMCKAVAEWNK